MSFQKSLSGQWSRGLAPSTTAVDDAGSRQGQQAPAYATASSRTPPGGLYTGVRMAPSNDTPNRQNWYGQLCTMGCATAVIRLASAQRAFLPAMVNTKRLEVRSRTIHMSYPHCGELCPPSSQGDHLDVLIDLGDLWTRAKQSVPETQRAWVDLTEPVALTHDSLVLVTGNEFTKDMLETKLRPHVQQALADQLGHQVTIEVIVDQSRAPQISDDLADDLADSTYSEPQTEPVRAVASRDETPPNPRYTFDTFVYGPSNRFGTPRPWPWPSSRPGPTTRCSSTVTPDWVRPTCCTPSATTPRRIFAGTRVHYVSSEEFTNDFINSIRDHGRVDFTAVTGMWTCCSSTTSSSCRARCRRRRSSSTPSTRCTTPTSRS